MRVASRLALMVFHKSGGSFGVGLSLKDVELVTSARQRYVDRTKSHRIWKLLAACPVAASPRPSTTSAAASLASCRVCRFPLPCRSDRRQASEIAAELRPLTCAGAPAGGAARTSASLSDKSPSVATRIDLVCDSTGDCYSAGSLLRLPLAPALDAPWLGLAVNAAASAINAGWAWVPIRQGRERKSPALVADGRHLLTDVISSVGVLGGVSLAVITGGGS